MAMERGEEMNILRFIFGSGKMPRDIPKCRPRPKGPIQPPLQQKIRPRIKAILDKFDKSPSLTINGVSLHKSRGQR
jgi:hypothetical protein